MDTEWYKSRKSLSYQSMKLSIQTIAFRAIDFSEWFPHIFDLFLFLFSRTLLLFWYFTRHKRIRQLENIINVQQPYSINKWKYNIHQMVFYWSIFGVLAFHIGFVSNCFFFHSCQTEFDLCQTSILLWPIIHLILFVRIFCYIWFISRNLNMNQIQSIGSLSQIVLLLIFHFLFFVFIHII